MIEFSIGIFDEWHELATVGRVVSVARRNVGHVVVEGEFGGLDIRLLDFIENGLETDGFVSFVN